MPKRNLCSRYLRPGEKELNDYGFVCMMNHKHMLPPHAFTEWLEGTGPYKYKAFE